MLRVISYDIVNNKRRRKVQKILKGYGFRVQFSVFECDLEQQEFEELKLRLDKAIKKRKDSIRFYSTCKICRSNIELVGTSCSLTTEDTIVV